MVDKVKIYLKVMYKINYLYNLIAGMDLISLAVLDNKNNMSSNSNNR